MDLKASTSELFKYKSNLFLKNPIHVYKALFLKYEKKIFPKVCNAKTIALNVVALNLKH